MDFGEPLQEGNCTVKDRHREFFYGLYSTVLYYLEVSPHVFNGSYLPESVFRVAALPFDVDAHIVQSTIDCKHIEEPNKRGLNLDHGKQQ